MRKFDFFFLILAIPAITESALCLSLVPGLIVIQQFSSSFPPSLLQSHEDGLNSQQCDRGEGHIGILCHILWLAVKESFYFCSAALLVLCTTHNVESMIQACEVNGSLSVGFRPHRKEVLHHHC